MEIQVNYTDSVTMFLKVCTERVNELPLVQRAVSLSVASRSPINKSISSGQDLEDFVVAGGQWSG